MECVKIFVMLHDLGLIFYSWFLSSLWVFLSLPIISTYTKNILKDNGWALNRTVGWLLIGLPVWYLAHLGIPINTKPGIWGVFFVLVLLCVYTWKKTQFNFGQFWKENKRFIIAEELLFVFGLFFLSIVRGYSPDINNLEKFMDGGLIVSYVKSPTLPLEDFWLAGSHFNYYTFGHFQGAIATQFWSMDPVISYNILLGLLLGLSLQLSFSVVVNLLSLVSSPTESFAKKIPLLKRLPFASKNGKYAVGPLIIVGLIGAYLINFAGNTQVTWYLLARCYSHFQQVQINFAPADENAVPMLAEACSMVGYWYPNATRFIPRTIHEFPSYSFIVSDLHAHVWNLVNVLAFILIVYLWAKATVDVDEKETPITKKRWLALTAVTGVFMGIFVMTSSWDALVYSLFLSIFSLVMLVMRPKLFMRLFWSGVMVALTMAVVSSPWWLNFDSISEGAAIANEHTVWWQLVVLWFAHVSISCIGAFLSFRFIRRNRTFSLPHLMIIALVLTGFALIVIPEFFYVKDIYTTQPRANTMFKLTYQAFIQLSIVMAITFGMLLSTLMEKKAQLGHKLAFVFIVIVFVCIGIYPYYGYRDFYLGSNAKYKTLDGLLWFQNEYPDDYQAYLWLKQVKGRPHILEAVGDSYTTFNRMSAFTGLPTVLGWRVHEWLWRGSYDIPGQRSSEVETIYLNPTSEESQRLLNQYLVKYIVVGKKEVEAYPALDPVELKKTGKVVFEQGNTFIIER
jgi:uncharacterized membrane protein